MTAPPGNLADRPATPADPLGLEAGDPPHDLLSQLLRSVRLSGERMSAYAPPRTFSIGFAQAGTLHLIEEGEVTVRVDAGTHVEHVSRGDVVLLPRGDAHHISDAAENDAPEAARWLCGTFTIGDPRASHLLGSLPAVIILRGGGGPALEGLDVARRMILVEMQSPSQGSAVMVARILDLIFIQILRAWAAGPDPEPNWLAGALDPQIGPALSAIHRDPGHEWTVEDLARACCLSGRRSRSGSPLVSASRRPPISRTSASTPLSACCATPRDPSLSSRKASATPRSRHSVARSRTTTACRRLAGDETCDRADRLRKRA